MTMLLELGWTQLWQLSLLIVLVGLTGQLLIRRRPGLVALLWLVVMIKAIFPPVWSFPTGLFSLAQASPTPKVDAGAVQPDQSFAAANATVAAAGGDFVPTAMALFVAGWATGAIVLLSISALRGWRLKRLIHRDRLPTDHPVTQFANEIGSELGRRRPVSVVASSDGWGPAVCGFWKTTILLPDQLANTTDTALLRPLILHELLHARRGDTLFACVQTVAKAIWWFHPLVWWAGRQADRVIERCIDRNVVAYLKDEPANYARGMLRVLELRCDGAHQAGLVGLCSAPLTQERLREVFEAAKQTNSPATRSAVAQICFLAAAFLLVLPGNPFDGFASEPCVPAPYRAKAAASEAKPQAASQQSHNSRAARDAVALTSRVGPAATKLMEGAR